MVISLGIAWGQCLDTWFSVTVDIRVPGWNPSTPTFFLTSNTLFRGTRYPHSLYSKGRREAAAEVNMIDGGDFFLNGELKINSPKTLVGRLIRLM